MISRNTSSGNLVSVDNTSSSTAATFPLPGTLAPDFKLPVSMKQSLSLSDFRGRPLVIYFYPLDFSPGCSEQAVLYNEVLDDVQALNAQLIGISVDSVFCHDAFSRDRNLKYPLLSDFEPKGAVARRFGVYDELHGVCERAVFVLDSESVIRWSYLSPTSVIPGADGFLAALEELKG